MNRKADKVIKRDVLSLFNIRSPLLMEKLFLYLCINSTQIFSVTTAAKELENTSVSTLESYMDALVMSNLIYLTKPVYKHLLSFPGKCIDNCDKFKWK